MKEIKIWYNRVGNKIIKTIYVPNKNLYITKEIKFF